MIELCKLIWCGLIGLFRSRASLEIEILALRHQLNILRRKSPKRPTFGSIDRMVFAGLYGLAPDVLSALAPIRPELVSDRDSLPAPSNPIPATKMESPQRKCVSGLFSCANSYMVSSH
jgi:hypothetical protein